MFIAPLSRERQPLARAHKNTTNTTHRCLPSRRCRGANRCPARSAARSPECSRSRTWKTRSPDSSTASRSRTPTRWRRRHPGHRSPTRTRCPPLRCRCRCRTAGSGQLRRRRRQPYWARWRFVDWWRGDARGARATQAMARVLCGSLSRELERKQWRGYFRSQKARQQRRGARIMRRGDGDDHHRRRQRRRQQRGVATTQRGCWVGLVRSCSRVWVK